MTPGARVSAAIEVLAAMEDGLAAEQALTRWARNSRFAGSKDRAAVRDHVFDVLRSKLTAAHLGGGASPRALLIGNLRAQGVDLETIFNGIGHAPVPLSEDEQIVPAATHDPAITWNLPAWLTPLFEAGLGDSAAETAMALQSRAPITLRVNLARITPLAAQEMLQNEGVETIENPLCFGALTVTDGQRKIRNSQGYLEGLVEFQDAASQAVVGIMPQGGTVLDYCAGGGGKALALAMDSTRKVFAHDVNSGRLADLLPRAERAEAEVAILETADLSTAAPFDVVLCDAPCSGSGAWRRAAEAKWNLMPERLEELTKIQDEILDDAAKLVGPEGLLAYATCSVFKSENEDRIAAFHARNSGWETKLSRRFAVDAWGDGFFTAHLVRV